MNKASYFITIAVSATAIGFLAGADWGQLPGLPAEHLIGLGAFIALGILSEFLRVNYRVGGSKATSSLTFIPWFAAIVLFPPPAALLNAGIVMSVAELAFHKRERLKATFNVAMVVAGTGLAILVYESLGGSHSLSTPHNYLAFGGLAAAFFTFNLLTLSVMLSALNASGFFANFYRLAGAGGANLVFDILVSPLGLAVAVLYANSGIPGLLLVVLPLVIVRHSYLAKLQLQQANRDLLRVLVKTIETRDPYTSGHSVRVSRLARLIAEDLGLRSRRVDDIETAALLHDIGKVDAVYATIIQKSGRLSDAEREVIQTHATRGAEFLRTLASFNNEVILGIRHHHERYDGRGYPDGLQGEQIPLSARIIMLCDSIDAMLSDRPYRKALSLAETSAELTRCAGTQFDPQIVNTVLSSDAIARAELILQDRGSLDPSVRPESLLTRV